MDSNRKQILSLLVGVCLVQLACAVPAPEKETPTKPDDTSAESVDSFESFVGGDVVKGIDGDWITSNNLTVPVMWGGNPMESMPVCHVTFQKEVIPGWEFVRDEACYFGFKQRALKTPQYQNLRAERPDGSLYLYHTGSSGSVCKYPVIGGHDKNKEPYYICSVEYFVDSVQVAVTLSGKLVPSKNACYVAIKGKEEKFTDYNVLCTLLAQK